MRIILFGAGGTLGHELADTLNRSEDHQLFAYTSCEADITDYERVAKLIPECEARIIINAAAYNAVDDAEDDPEAALRVNGMGVMALAILAEKHGATLVHYSSDYVFDGEKGSAYDENDPPNPLSAYARSKRLGEIAALETCRRCYVLRTASVFGRHGKNFFTKLLAAAKHQTTIRMVDDLAGSPTAATDLARATLALLEKKAPYGLYHAAGAASCSRFEWARGIAETAGLRPSIEPAHSREFKSKARRPRNSTLASEKLRQLGIHIRPWYDTLEDIFNPA